MRVALVTSTFLPSFVGGREIHVYGLARALTKRGLDVFIVTGDNVTNMLQERLDDMVICRIPYIKEILLGGKNETIPYRITSYHLFKVLRLIKPDIIHAHDIKHFTSDCAAIWSAVSFTPLVLTVHGIYYKPLKYTKLLFLAHDLTLNLFTLNVARKIIVVSKSLIKYPLTLFRSKIIYIPNAISLDYLQNGETHYINFRRIYNIPDDALLVVIIARLTHQKGIDILIKAWKILQKTHQEIKATLVIIGPIHSQWYYRYLVKLAEGIDSIIFTGKIPTSLVKSALREADVFVLPSRDEGFPTALLEAMYFGKPVVASSVGAIPSIVFNQVNGILVRPNSAEELAKALSIVLLNDKLRYKLSRNAEVVKEIFSWDNIVKYIIRVYEEVIRR